jgi:hypothetical protein
MMPRFRKSFEKFKQHFIKNKKKYRRLSGFSYLAKNMTTLGMTVIPRLGWFSGKQFGGRHLPDPRHPLPYSST